MNQLNLLLPFKNINGRFCIKGFLVWSCVNVFQRVVQAQRLDTDLWVSGTVWKKTEKEKKQQPSQDPGVGSPYCLYTTALFPAASADLQVGHWSMFLISRHMSPIKLNSLMLTRLEKSQIKEPHPQKKKAKILYGHPQR